MDPTVYADSLRLPKPRKAIPDRYGGCIYESSVLYGWRNVGQLYAAEEPLESMLDSETDKKLVSAVFAKLQWEVGAQSIEEDLARVHLKITAVPYRKMVQAYETHVKENLESYRAKYSDMDDGTYQAAILEDRLAFYQAYTETVTTEVDMDLVYQEDRWIISHCEGLSNALLGESDV